MPRASHRRSRPRAGVVFAEGGEDGPEAVIEGIVLERARVLDVLLIAEKIDARVLLLRRRGRLDDDRRGRRELAVDDRLQILERNLEELRGDVHGRTGLQVMDERALP